MFIMHKGDKGVKQPILYYAALLINSFVIIPCFLHEVLYKIYNIIQLVAVN